MEKSTSKKGIEELERLLYYTAMDVPVELMQSGRTSQKGVNFSNGKAAQKRPKTAEGKLEKSTSKKGIEELE